MRLYPAPDDGGAAQREHDTTCSLDASAKAFAGAAIRAGNVAPLTVSAALNSARAARWSTFAAAALSGILQSDGYDASVAYERHAGDIADRMLLEHDRRFK